MWQVPWDLPRTQPVQLCSLGDPTPSQTCRQVISWPSTERRLVIKFLSMHCFAVIGETNLDEKKRNKKSAVIIAVTVVLCVAFIGAAVFTAVYIYRFVHGNFWCFFPLINDLFKAH